MTSAIKKLVSVIALLVSLTSLSGQTDSLTVDSITSRIKEILNEYNNRTLYADTSDYVQYGADANELNLQTAASVGACNEIIRLFVRGADIDSYAGGPAAPIHYAISSGRWEAVEILLLLGADPHKTDYQGNSPLVVAVRANYAEIAEKLIRYGARVDHADRQNSTPLHHSAALGNLLMTDMLLYYDAPTEMHDSEGNTPLMTSVCFGYHDIADILLQSGADPDAPDRRGFTPLMAASQNGDTLMMSILVKAGASLYSLNNDGLDALGCAVLSNQHESVAYLLGRGNRWNHTAGTGTYPVTLANNTGRTEILKMLLERGMEGKRVFSLSELSVAAGGRATSHYSMIGGSVSVSGPGIRTGITIGASASPVSMKMLVRGDDEILYQYSVRSNLIYAGPFMKFMLNKPYSEFRIYAVPSLSMGYRFHSLYEGTEERPENSIVVIPAAELQIARRNIGISAGLSFLSLPFYRAGPVWLTLGASYNLTRPAGNLQTKRVRLYNYE